MSVNKAGECSSCEWRVKFDTNQRIRIIQDSQKLISNSKNTKTVFSRYKVLFEHLEAIAGYEARGYSLMEPSATTLLSGYLKSRQETASLTIKSEIESIEHKASLQISAKPKINDLNKALLKIAEWKKEFIGFGVDDLLETEEVRIQQNIHSIRLAAFMTEYDKAIFMGKKDRAKAQLQEALYFVKTDMIPDEQQVHIISDIEAKLKELS